MKISQLVLIFAIIGYCISEDDECSTGFDSKLAEICSGINSETCQYVSPLLCIKKNPCSGEGACSGKTHPIPTIYKCAGSDGQCQETKKECSDFVSEQDSCPALFSGDESKKRCVLNPDNTCSPHFNRCEDFTGATETTCPNNIPSDILKECVWNDGTCQTVYKKCTDSSMIYPNANQENCYKLTISEEGKTANKKKCVYSNTEYKCYEEYEKCEDYEEEVEDTCTRIQLLKTGTSDYEQLKKCILEEGETEKICKTATYCEDFDKIADGSKSPEMCISLKSKNAPNKRCVYDYNDNSCKDEFKSCSLGEESESTCSSIILLDNLNKKCVWKNNNCIESYKGCSGQNLFFCNDITLEDHNKRCIKNSYNECEETYVSCDAYKGKDKEICESIILESGKKCYLARDSKCILPCTEANSLEECKIAKPIDDKKECVYYGGTCIEQYKKCEDYTGNNLQTCESIALYNGKKCVLDSTGCKSYNKICTEAVDEDECKLMTNSGVSSSDRYCDYDSTSGCFENYKYCSDYRGTDNNFCVNKIKPFDESGLNVDITSSCEYDSVVGCKRKINCSNAGKNSTLCNIISTKLAESTKNKKYCSFINGNCEENYQTCGSYDEEEYEAFQSEKCESIKPKNYLTHGCEVGTEDGKPICKDKEKTPKECSNFNGRYSEAHFQSLCINIKPYCLYSTGSCTKKSCNDYISSDADEIRCKLIPVSDSNKICSLKAGGSACEIIDKKKEEEENDSTESSAGSSNEANEPSQEAKPDEEKQTPSENNPQQGNSSGSNVKGIGFIVILLCLLI